ncbi:MAG: polysaccharide biosynthesis C-terminal domain-containing protein [Bacteroidales bacterium]|nr:polysaccharide biosynthesis C-terminal domain-containing protein [Bacteroidales bacterium]
MHKRFITNISLLIFLNLLVKPLWILGIDRTVQNIVGAEVYGFYFSLLNVSFLFNIFLDLGVTNFNNRNIAQYSHLLNKHFSGIVVLKFALSFVYTTIILLFAWLVDYNLKQIGLLLILCMNQFLASFILYLRSNITGLQLYKTDSILSVLDRVLMLIICSVLIWGNITNTPFKIEWFIYAQSFSYAITLIIAAVVVMKKAKFKRFSWNIPFYLVILKKSAPYALLILLMFFYYRLDGIMIERLLPQGAFEAGIYAAGFRLLDAAAMTAYLFPVILLPTFSKMIKEHERINALFKLSLSVILTGALTLGIISYFYKLEIMSMLYHNDTKLSAPVFGVLMLCFPAIAAGNIFSTLLTANGSLKHLNIYAFCGMVINIILNLILIPKFKALGSAYASLFTQYLVLVLQVFTVSVFFKFRIRFKYFLSFVLYIGSLTTVCYFSKMLPLPWSTVFLLLFVVSVFLSFLTSGNGQTH